MPLLAGFLAYYFKIGMQPDSAAQHPERLHRERGFMVYLAVCLVAFVLLMFTSMPVALPLVQRRARHHHPPLDHRPLNNQGQAQFLISVSFSIVAAESAVGAGLAVRRPAWARPAKETAVVVLGRFRGEIGLNNETEMRNWV